MSLECAQADADATGVVRPRNIGPSPAVRLGVIEGIEVVLLSVEIWRGQVFVRTACVESPETERVNDEYSATVREMTPLLREARAKFPENPAAAILSHVQVTISDDAGTTYRWTDANGPGWNGQTGINWFCDNRFVPGPPTVASVLRVSATVGDTTAQQVDLPLRP